MSSASFAPICDSPLLGRLASAVACLSSLTGGGGRPHSPSVDRRWPKAEGGTFGRGLQSTLLFHRRPASADPRRLPSSGTAAEAVAPTRPPSTGAGLRAGVGRRLPSAGAAAAAVAPGPHSAAVDWRRPTGRRRPTAVACLRPVPRRRQSPPGPTRPPSTGAGRRAGVGHRLSSPVSPAVNRRLPSPAFDRRRSGPTRPPSTGARLADGRRVPSTSAVAAGTS